MLLLLLFLFLGIVDNRITVVVLAILFLLREVVVTNFGHVSMLVLDDGRLADVAVFLLGFALLPGLIHFLLLHLRFQTRSFKRVFEWLDATGDQARQIII